MKIHELEITDLRGIRHLLLEPRGQNVVIWGPNGSGKSGVVDAVEFLLQGRISRLVGAGTQGITLAAHGPHIDRSVDTALVRAIIELPGVEGQFEVSRSLASPNTLVCPAEIKSEIEAILEAASAGQYVLARREILGFVTATGGDRGAAVQKLLRLEELENTRKILRRAAGIASREAGTKEDDLRVALNAVSVTAGLGEFNEDDILVCVNAARDVLGGASVAALDPDGIVADLQQHGQSAKDVQVLRLLELASPLRDQWRQDASLLAADAAELHASVVVLCEDPGLLSRLDRHDLVVAGIGLIADDGSCPLCDADWEPGALATKLAGDLSALQAVADNRDQICEQAGRIRLRAKALGGMIDDIRRLAVALELASDDCSLSAWVMALEEYVRALGVLATRIDASSPTSITPPALLSADADVGLLDSIILNAQALNPDATPEQKASELLGRLSENLKAAEVARTNLENTRSVATRLGVLSDSFTTASNEVLNGLFESVKNRFVELYSSLHAEDGEDAFAARLERNDAALDFEVDFFRRGLHPPHALHSEGHQDSMGVCLYLALAERVNSGLINLVVLDDVVMSVDSGHRKRLAGLLADQFVNTQFVITTHERAWAQQLKYEGVVAGAGLVHFCDWSLESGPRRNEGDVWDKIDSCLASDDVRGAASYLRGYMEEYFAQACENLEASVVYRGTGGYALGDFLPAACSRLLKWVKEAKAAANSWNDEVVAERLAETQSVIQQCYETTTAEGWAVNKGVHYDQWVTLSPADLTDVVSAYRDLCDAFVCTSCSRPLRLTRAGMIPMSVQCACGQVNWNLQRR